MHLYPGDISDNLEDQATEHGSHEAPCLVLDAERHLRDDQEGEDTEQQGIAGQGGEVSEMGLFERTSCEGAKLVRNGVIPYLPHCEGCDLNV